MFLLSTPNQSSTPPTNKEEFMINVLSEFLSRGKLNSVVCLHYVICSECVFSHKLFCAKTETFGNSLVLGFVYVDHPGKTIIFIERYLTKSPKIEMVKEELDI